MRNPSLAFDRLRQAACAVASAMADSALDLVAPRACAGCDRPDLLLCPSCRSLLFRPLSRPAPAYATGLALACAPYRGAVRRIILSWKDHDNRPLDRPLGQVMADLAPALSRLIDPLLRPKPARAILVVPAPSSLASLRRRGRVHLQPILLSLAQALQRHGLAAQVESALIMNSVRTKSVQAGGRRNRSHRLAGRIAVADPSRLAGHPVLVVDDIITTGSTIRQCARALETVGALPLAALALAAVPPGHEDR
ncbi:ComF family protein [Bifidobacterium apousia]|uniref:ComF family protein n=2 Tax=Bifidobacterium TaxID=1678 RepID=A0A556R2R6_9BIFI|nr:ComF family protein [Bifidobacterium apousia]